MKKKLIISGICLVLVISCGILYKNYFMKEKNVIERTVVINYNPNNYASAIFQIAKEKDLFSKYLPKGVKIKWTTLTSASDIRDSMVSGEIDIGTPGIMAFMTAVDNGMPLTLMSFNGYATVKLYSNKNNIKNIKDFKSGDQISISGLASNPQAAYIAALKEEGLSVEKYNKMLVKVPDLEAISLLKENQQIKGSVLSFSSNLKAEKINSVHLIRDFSDVIEKYSIGTALIANTTFYEKNRDICDAILKVQKDVIDNWKKDLDSNSKLLAKQYNCDVSDVIELMKKQPPTNKLTGYDKLAELLYSVNLLSTKLKLKDLANYNSIPR